MNARPSTRPRRWLKPALFVACSLPAIWLLLRGFEVVSPGLGPNPIEELMRRLGDWCLRFLLATLCITPLAVILRKPWIVGLRRMLGLFAFSYICLHFLNWLVLDRFFDWPSMLADIAKRPFITVGFTAFVLLIPLAVTSTNGWMRRLGRRWVVLHRLIYPAAVLGCLHYWWLVKADVREPFAYAAVLAVLLGWRIRRAQRARRLRDVCQNTAPRMIATPR